MGSFIGYSNRIYFGPLDLTGLANEVTFGPVQVAMKECTTFADGGFSCFKPGLISGSGSVKGFQSYAANELDATISIGQVGSQYAFSVVPNDAHTAVAAGDVAWFSRGVVNTLHPFDGAVGDMAKFELDQTFDTAPVQGKVGAPLAAVTGNTNGAAVAMAGPSASQKLWSVLHVTAYSGFTNVVFKVQSDDNSGFSSPTDRITFSTVTGTTSQFSSVAGSFSSETHHRVTATVTGSGSVSYVAAFGVL